MLRAYRDLTVICETPAIGEHPQQPDRVPARLVEHNPPRNPAGMTRVAHLADDRADRLTTLCHQHHASARAGVGREAFSPIESVSHAAKPIVIRSPIVPSKRNSGSSKFPATISSIRGRSVANRWQTCLQDTSPAWSARFPGSRSRFRVVGPMSDTPGRRLVSAALCADRLAARCVRRPIVRLIASEPSHRKMCLEVLVLA